jgi:hypothetical protein
MAVAPEQFRAARLAIPRMPLPAVLGFVFLGIGGSIFLTYTAFNHGEEKRFVAASDDSHVYAAPAVPFDPAPEDPSQRAASIARALAAAQSEALHATDARFESQSENSDRIVVSESDRELRGFSRFATLGGTNSYLAMKGAGFGISAETTPVGFMAPDATTFGSTVVPEASTWCYGCALFMLVAARGAHAHWHRKRRREQ